MHVAHKLRSDFARLSGPCPQAVAFFNFDTDYGVSLHKLVAFVLCLPVLGQFVPIISRFRALCFSFVDQFFLFVFVFLCFPVCVFFVFFFLHKAEHCP